MLWAYGFSSFLSVKHIVCEEIIVVHFANYGDSRKTSALMLLIIDVVLLTMELLKNVAPELVVVHS